MTPSASRPRTGPTPTPVETVAPPGIQCFPGVPGGGPSVIGSVPAESSFGDDDGAGSAPTGLFVDIV